MSPEEKQKIVEEEKLKQLQAQLSEEHTLTFTKGELLVIFNILTRKEFVFGDFMAIYPVIKKLEPIVSVESNIVNVGEKAREAETNHKESLIGVKKESN